MSALGCLFLSVFSWYKLKDLIAPPFIVSSIWALLYVLLFIFWKDEVDFYHINYFSFFISSIFFYIGFFFIVGDKTKNNREISKINRINNFKFNDATIKLIISMQFAITILLIYKASSFLASNFSFNIWQTLHAGKGMGLYKEGLLIEYSRSSIMAFSLICNVMFFSNPCKKNMKYFISTIIMATIFAFTGGNRGVIFLLVIAHFFSFMIVKNYNNKKVARILRILVVLILIVFFGFAFLKYVYVDKSNIGLFLFEQFKKYFSSSLVAFVEWSKDFNDYLYGTNTFRFIMAVLNSLGFDAYVTNTVQQPTVISGSGETTNVHTILHYYVSDFGMLYAFSVQLFLGVIHGYLYKKAILTKNINSFYIAVISLLYFPLINQFFDDKYFSMLSSWIQYIFWLWLYTRKIVISRKPNNTRYNSHITSQEKGV